MSANRIAYKRRLNRTQLSRLRYHDLLHRGFYGRIGSTQKVSRNVSLSAGGSTVDNDPSLQLVCSGYLSDKTGILISLILLTHINFSWIGYEYKK